MHVDGHCYCGFITYEAEIDPATARICHCTDCQMMSGSAFRTNVSTGVGGFRLLSGTPKEFVKLADSGRRRIMGFCPECGTQVYSAGEGPDPKPYNLRVGTIRQRDQIEPKVQIWWRSALPWSKARLDDIRHLDTDH